MMTEDIIAHIKARKKAYLDSTDDPELVEAVVFELDQILQRLGQKRL